MKIHFDIKLLLKLFPAFAAFAMILFIIPNIGFELAAKCIGADTYFDFLRFGHYCKSPENTPFRIFVTALGCPLLNAVLGTSGFLLSIRYKQKLKDKDTLNSWQWLFIFLTCFWLYEFFMLVFVIINNLIEGKIGNYLGTISAANYLGWPPLILASFTWLLGTAMLAYVFLMVIPRQQKLTFLVSGLSGGMLGYYLWILLLGNR